jgi:aerobic-type carbon monoxide dehydrogenase small subunit (CoxS/CutS family)
LKVNGKDYELQIEPQWTLQRTLQFKLGMTGAKTMCDRGVCGSCTVIVDGRAVLSCTTLAVECEGKSIETIEGIAANPRWKPLIQSYAKWDAMQCGYCTPGFVVSAVAILSKREADRSGHQAGPRREHLLLRHLSAASDCDHRSGAGSFGICAGAGPRQLSFRPAKA